MKNYEVRPGFELDLTGGLVLIDLARVLAHLRLPDDITSRYDLTHALITGLDDFAEESFASSPGIPTPSNN